MWFIRTLFPAVIVIILLGFAFLNPTETVNVNLFWKTYFDVQLTIVVFFSVLLGMAVMLSLSVYHDLKIRAQMRMLRAEKMEFEKELMTLRTTPLEGLDSSAEEQK